MKSSLISNKKISKTVLIFFIILPLFFNSILIYSSYMSYILDIDTDLTYAIGSSVIFLAVCPFAVLINPIPRFVQNYFTKNGFNVVREYDIIKKILYFSIPIMLFDIILLTTHSFFPFYEWGEDYGTYVAFFVIATFFWAIAISVYGSLKLGILVLQNEFSFFLSKLLLQKGISEIDNLKKIEYVIRGIQTYNKFLNRRLGFHIKDTEYIFDKILSEDLNSNTLLTSLGSKMDKGKTDLLQFLIEQYSIPEKQFLQNLTMRDRFNSISPSLTVIIPFVIFLIQLGLGNVKFPGS